jgi:hypothetical protein
MGSLDVPRVPGPEATEQENGIASKGGDAQACLGRTLIAARAFIKWEPSSTFN